MRRKYLLTKKQKGIILSLFALAVIILLKLYLFNGVFVVAPDEVKNQPNKYINHTIAVRGYYIQGIPFLYSGGVSTTATVNTEAEAMDMLTNTLPINYDGNTSLFDGARYCFVGDLKQKETVSGSYYYLDVHEVNSVSSFV